MIAPDDNTHIHISKAELWVIRSVGGALLAVLGWIGVQAQDAVVQLAEIKRELEITKPADVLEAVNHLERISLTKSEVSTIIRNEAPWNEVKKDWDDWRRGIQRYVDRSTDDRWRAGDMRSWIRALEKANPDLDIPDMPERLQQ